MPGTHNFSHLANEVLPRYMAELQQSRQYPMVTFITPGHGPAAILRRLDRRTDLPGCYVLWEQGRPFYVGISRKVVTRLMQHVRDQTHFGASLAYRMACNGEKHGMRRQQAMDDAVFRHRFDEARRRITAMDVSFIQIDDPIERYLFEVYVCLELKTHQFNSFETH